jgi:hypothetical protein
MRSLSTTVATVAAALVGLAACAPATAADPNAIAPRYDRWETVVAAPKATVYATALRVLTDSSYTTTTASAEGGVIQTAPRKASEVQRGGQQLKTMALGGDDPLKLNVVITPVGTDSSRLSVSGQYLMENIGQWMRVDARGETRYWPNVSGMGMAIAGRLARP